MSTYPAVIGANALWLTYLWLASAIVASYLSNRKGYGERPGLASGLLLSAIGVVIWLLWPAKPDSRWKLQGPFGSGGKTIAQARAEQDGVAQARAEQDGAARARGERAGG